MILASQNILEAPILLHLCEEGFSSINALKKPSISINQLKISA